MHTCYRNVPKHRAFIMPEQSTAQPNYADLNRAHLPLLPCATYMLCTAHRGCFSVLLHASCCAAACWLHAAAGAAWLHHSIEHSQQPSGRAARQQQRLSEEILRCTAVDSCTTFKGTFKGTRTAVHVLYGCTLGKKSYRYLYCECECLTYMYVAVKLCAPMYMYYYSRSKHTGTWLGRYRY